MRWLCLSLLDVEVESSLDLAGEAGQSVLVVSPEEARGLRAGLGDESLQPSPGLVHLLHSGLEGLGHRLQLLGDGLTHLHHWGDGVLQGDLVRVPGLHDSHLEGEVLVSGAEDGGVQVPVRQERTPASGGLVADTDVRRWQLECSENVSL